MKASPLSLASAACFLSLGLVLAPVAMAETGPAQGQTSGPAAGTQTTPNTAVQKQASNPGGTAVGAPGTEGKRGVESGGQPRNPANGTAPTKQP